MQRPNQHSDADATGEEPVFKSVTKRFGIQTDLISELRRECVIFDEICTDYEECWNKLRKLERENQVLSRRSSDYTTMLELLEEEMNHCFKGAPPCRCRLKARESKLPGNRVGTRLNPDECV